MSMQWKMSKQQILQGKSQMRWLTLWKSVNQSMMQTILR